MGLLTEGFKLAFLLDLPVWCGIDRHYFFVAQDLDSGFDHRNNARQATRLANVVVMMHEGRILKADGP